MLSQREGGVVKETLIATGRSCGSIWSLALGALCMRERKHSKLHQTKWEWANFCWVHPLRTTTCSLGWRPASCVRSGMPARERPDIIAYLSEFAELVCARHQCINKSEITLGGFDFYSFLPHFYILCFIHFLCAGLMYFIELVTTEHKLGITTLCIKKICPQREMEAVCF